MTNPSIPANLTRDEARAVREWAERAHAEEVQDAAVAHAARVLLAVLPRPTLADMTAEERAECRRMQADVKGYENRAAILQPYLKDGSARVMWATLRVEAVSWANITPRPDLPRMEWPRDTGIPGVAIDVPVTDPDLIQRISDEAPTGTIVAEANLNATVRNGRYWHSAEEAHLTLAEALFHAPHEWDAIGHITVVRWGE